MLRRAELTKKAIRTLGDSRDMAVDAIFTVAKILSFAGSLSMSNVPAPIEDSGVDSSASPKDGCQESTHSNN